LYDPLKLRGAIVFLHKAIVHVGNGHRTDEWGDGSYLDKNIEAADNILRKASWLVEKEFRDTYEQGNLRWATKQEQALNKRTFLECVTDDVLLSEVRRRGLQL
jgi:hypothetical protein